MTRVLIVDDNPENLELLRVLLEADGWIVDEARHGAEALLKARQIPPQLIVSDLLMPVMDGFTLLRQWKADDRLKRIPFVVYTATYTEPKDEKLALDLGADAFILKPTEPQEFLARIKAVQAQAGGGESPALRGPKGDPDVLLREYGDVLVTKLEEKARQLEAANRALQEDLERRRQAEAEANRLRAESDRARIALLGIMEDERRTEAALRQSQALYRSLVDQLPAGVFRKDAAGRYVFVNQQYLSLHGLTAPEEILGRTALEVAGTFARPGLPEAEQHRLRLQTGEGAGHHRMIMETARPIEMEEEWPDASGAPRVFQAVKTPVFDPERRAIGSQGVLIDITERKRAERNQRAALAEAERLRAAVDRVSAHVYLKDTQSRYIYANQPTRELFKCTAEELVGADDYRFFPRDVADHLRAVDARVFRGEATEEEIVIADPDGTERVYWETKTPLFTGPDRTEVWGLIGISTDVTDRRRTAETLRLLSRAFEQSPVSIVITNARAEIRYVNPRFEQVSGYSAAEVVGRNPRILKSGETLPAVYREMWSTLAAGREWHGEFHNKKKSGELFWEWASISPVKDEQGRIAHFVAVKEDITERKKLQEQFLRAQRLESIGMLAAGIAHDLNNVLAPIAMVAPLLRGSLREPRHLRLLETLEKSVDRGAGLVRQILGFSHGIGGEPRLMQAKHLLREIAEVAVETFPKSIKVTCQVPSDLWPILGNPTQVHQVMLNLCVNARDAMPDGGQLTLSAENCRLDEAAAARIAGARPGAWIVLRVADTGTGIPPELLARIWEPFFTTKAPDRGTGLGLSTVRGIVERHQGFVELQTELGRGTTFRVFLPAAEAGDEVVGGTRAVNDKPGKGEWILLVDDEVSIRETARAVLTAAGYQVVVAADGVEAAALFGQRPGDFSLVITDLDMPNLGGAGLVRKIRLLRTDLPVVAMSGLASHAEDRAIASDFAAFIIKPFTADLLLQELERLLRREPHPQ